MRMDQILEELKDLIDVQKLKQSKELKTSIEDETKRQLVDTAKKRAAAQNVDYPCFAALVSCAHLKPMLQKELGSTTRVEHQRHNRSSPAWSFDTSGHLQHDRLNMDVRHELRKPETIKNDNEHNLSERFLPHSGFPLSCLENPVYKDDEPKNATQYNSEVVTSSMVHDSRNQRASMGNISKLEKIKTTKPKSQELLYTSDIFIKEWRLCNAISSFESLNFLRKFSPSTLPVIFRTEIPPFLLKGILETLCYTIVNDSKRVEDKDDDNDEVMKNMHNQKLILDDYTLDASISSNVEQKKYGFVTDDLVSDLGEQSKRVPFQQQEEMKLAPSARTENDEELAQWIVSVLFSLRKCGRFGLAVKLIGQESRYIARKIIDYVFTTRGDSNMISMFTNEIQPMDLFVSYNCV